MDPRRIQTIGRWTLTVCASAFVLLLIQQGARPLWNARRDLGEIREAAMTYTQARGLLDQVSTQVRDLEARIEASEQALPRDPELDRFLGRLEASARRTNVRVELLTPGAITERGLFREQPVDVRVTGSFPQIYALLDRLEHSDQLSRVEELRIAGIEGEGRCAADIRLALYFAPREES